jgi:hypothetical protein
MALLGPLCVLLIAVRVSGTLFPQTSLTRSVRSLDGFWDFRLPPKSNPNAGIWEKWYKCNDAKGKVTLFSTVLYQKHMNL